MSRYSDIIGSVVGGVKKSFALSDHDHGDSALINGAFEIWQRTTSDAAVTTARKYVADRWAVKTGAGILTSVARSTTVPTGSLAQYSLALTGKAGVTTVDVGQRIEASNIPKINRTVTFSAKIYNNTGAAFTPVLLVGTPSASDNFTTTTVRNGGSGENLQSCADQAWNTVSWTADISGYTNILYGLEVVIRIPSGSMVDSGVVYITEVQLIPGSVVSQFSKRMAGIELALCQRYYEIASGNAYESIFQSYVSSGQTYRFGVPFKTQKRSSPVCTYANLSGDVGFDQSAPTSLGANIYGHSVYKTANATVASGYYYFSWTADSEL